MAALQVGGDGIAPWSPGSLLVSVSNGRAGLPVRVTIDGVVQAQTAVLAADGTLAALTVMVPSLTVGAHVLLLETISGGSVVDSGTLNFTVVRRPTAAPAASVPPIPQPPHVPGRWQFEDPVTTDVYVLPINPSAESGLRGPRNIGERQTTTGQPLSTEGTGKSQTWVLTGTILNVAQYDAFMDWSSRLNRLFITDDFGRQFVGVVTGFGPVPFAPHSSEGQPIRATYQFTIEVET